MYAEKVKIVVRENYKIKGQKPSKAVVATLDFDGYLDLDKIEGLMAFLEEHVYPFDPVSFHIEADGTHAG